MSFHTNMWLKFPYFSLQKRDKNPKTEKVNHKSQNLGLKVARFNAIHQDVHIISAVTRIFHADYGTCCQSYIQAQKLIVYKHESGREGWSTD